MISLGLNLIIVFVYNDIGLLSNVRNCFTQSLAYIIQTVLKSVLGSRSLVTVNV